MYRSLTLLVALAATVAPAVQAQPVTSDRLEAALDALPTDIAGVQHRPREPGEPLVVYGGQLDGSPLIAVAMADIGTPSSPDTARTLGRGDAKVAGLIKILFEGRFAVPGHPDAVTFFGEYLTNKGLKQAWLLERGGQRTMVSVTIFRTEDRRRVFDDIRARLLGGAVMIKAPLAAKSN
ncbi:hypothetical protein [Sphingomonas sp.]|uniref:hypothetical protein n=1 Tax=Sphingomonas sp. TaxID=28214 RepID=UPI003D6D0E06